MLDHLDPFPRQSIALVLYRMLTGARFDVSVVRDCLDVAGLTPPHERLQAVRLHHLSPYGEMPPGLHAELAAQTLALFAGRPVLGDGFLKDLAGMAGLEPSTAPSIQALVPTARA